MYLESAHSATSPVRTSSLLKRILDRVDTSCRTSDGMATISREDNGFHGDGLRFEFRNGYSVHISLDYLQDYLDDLKGLKGDFLPSLAACVARDGFHAHGGKEAFCVTFYQWMAADNYRTCRSGRLAADLPVAISFAGN
jgi:hypothetical protein